MGGQHHHQVGLPELGRSQVSDQRHPGEAHRIIDARAVTHHLTQLQLRCVDMRVDHHHLGPQPGQLGHDRQRRTLAHVGDVGLVRGAQHHDP